MHKENIKSSLRDSILRDIHEKNIQPRARWQYVLLHGALWFTGVITLIIWSFACAFVLLEFSLPERAYLRWIETQENVWWLLALPYFWGIGMIVALTIGHFIFSKTGRGYRFHASVIAGILILWSLLGGEILYLSRMAHWSDRQMQRFEPRYRDMRQNFARMLPRVEDGVLPLRVTSVSWDTIQGITPDGHNWTVKLDCKSDNCREKWKKIPTGRPIIFEGKMSAKGEFEASEIEFPPKWGPKNIRKKDSFLKKDVWLRNESEEKREE